MATGIRASKGLTNGGCRFGHRNEENLFKNPSVIFLVSDENKQTLPMNSIDGSRLLAGNVHRPRVPAEATPFCFVVSLLS